MQTDANKQCCNLPGNQVATPQQVQGQLDQPQQRLPCKHTCPRRLERAQQTGYMSLRPGFSVPGSLRPRFYVFATFMQLFFATFCNSFATFLQQFFFATFLQKKWQLFCTKKATFLQLVLQLFVARKVVKMCIKCAKTVSKSCKKKLQQTCKRLEKKLHKSGKHIEPGTR